jgi:hypothetical protein
MAYLTTFEGEDTATAAPLTIKDLFNVNDYYGVKLFGDAWNDVKRAAAIIAQRAVNAPILFYIRAQGKANAAPGQSSEIGRKLWGYNDAAGVELLGAPTWGAVKNEFDELLGWNPFTTLKNVGSTLLTPVTWAAGKLEKTNLPVVKQLGTSIKFLTSMGTEFTPITTAERLTNLSQAKGYVTQAEIDEAYRIEQEAKRQQALKDSAARASAAAAAAAQAQQEYESKLQALEQAAQATGLDTAAQAMATTQQAATDNTKTILLVGGGLAAIYLLTRSKG